MVDSDSVIEGVIMAVTRKERRMNVGLWSWAYGLGLGDTMERFLQKCFQSYVIDSWFLSCRRAYS